MENLDQGISFLFFLCKFFGYLMLLGLSFSHLKQLKEITIAGSLALMQEK